MLAEAEDVEANFVGEYDLFEEVGDALPGGDGGAGDGVWDECGEAVDADLHGGGAPCI
jgi:hypothetical protein